MNSKGIFETVQEDLERKSRREKSNLDYHRWKNNAIINTATATFFNGPVDNCLRENAHYTAKYLFKTDENGEVISYLDGTPLLTQLCNLAVGDE